MNYLKKGLVVIAGSFAFNVLETWHFGWNLYPQSTLEGFASMATGVGLSIGFALMSGHVIASVLDLTIQKRESMKQLVALVKISYYYRQSGKALDKALEALNKEALNQEDVNQEDIDEAERYEAVYHEYEKKASACDWRKEESL